MVSFTSSEWSGKGIKYWFRYCYRNSPEALIGLPFFVVFVPSFIYIHSNTWSKWHHKNTRFLRKYLVLRPDDQRIKNVLKFDSSGNRIFLEPK